MISTNDVPIQFLRRQLEYVYRQITFVLTSKVRAITRHTQSHSARFFQALQWFACCAIAPESGVIFELVDCMTNRCTTI